MRVPRRLGHGEPAELVDHLGELRSRLVVSLIAFSGAFALTYAFHARLIEWLNSPLPAGKRPITLGVAEPFTTSLKVSAAAALALALPIVFWQLWAFLAPAFLPHVQRAIASSVAVASLLFAAGIAFGYRIALPAAVHFLTNYDSSIYDIQVRASSYYSFALLVLVAVGIVFELPVFVLVLVRLGILTSRKLRQTRRIGYVAVAALAVALPGVDPVTTAMEMIPLMILYEASIWLAVVFEKRWHSSLATASNLS